MAERECRMGLCSDLALNFHHISETLITLEDTQNYEDNEGDHRDDEQGGDDDEDDDDD